MTTPRIDTRLTEAHRALVKVLAAAAVEAYVAECEGESAGETSESPSSSESKEHP